MNNNNILKIEKLSKIVSIIILAIVFIIFNISLGGANMWVNSTFFYVAIYVFSFVAILILIDGYLWRSFSPPMILVLPILILSSVSFISFFLIIVSAFHGAWLPALIALVFTIFVVVSLFYLMIKKYKIVKDTYSGKFKTTKEMQVEFLEQNQKFSRIGLIVNVSAAIIIGAVVVRGLLIVDHTYLYYNLYTDLLIISLLLIALVLDGLFWKKIPTFIFVTYPYLLSIVVASFLRSVALNVIKGEFDIKRLLIRGNLEPYLLLLTLLIVCILVSVFSWIKAFKLYRLRQQKPEINHED